MKPKIDLNKVNPLTLVLITIIVLTLGVLLGKSLLPLLNVPTVTEEKVGPQLDIVTNISQRDRFAGYKVTLPAGWNVSYTLASPANSNWKCVQGDDCQIMVITHDVADAKLTQIVLSTPVAVRYAWTGNKEVGEQEITLNGEKIMTTTERYVTFNENVDTQASLLLQLYGCNAQLLCISAGPFPADTQANPLQLIELNAFLQQAKFERI